MGSPVRDFYLGSEGEGCEVDDATGALYVSEEDVGIWRYDLTAPTGLVPPRVLFASVGGPLLSAGHRRPRAGRRRPVRLGPERRGSSLQLVQPLRRRHRRLPRQLPHHRRRRVGRLRPDRRHRRLRRLPRPGLPRRTVRLPGRLQRRTGHARAPRTSSTPRCTSSTAARSRPGLRNSRTRRGRALSTRWSQGGDRGADAFRGPQLGGSSRLLGEPTYAPAGRSRERVSAGRRP